MSCSSCQMSYEVVSLTWVFGYIQSLIRPGSKGLRGGTIMSSPTVFCCSLVLVIHAFFSKNYFSQPTWNPLGVKGLLLHLLHIQLLIISVIIR